MERVDVEIVGADVLVSWACGLRCAVDDEADKWVPLLCGSVMRERERETRGCTDRLIRIVWPQLDRACRFGLSGWLGCTRVLVGPVSCWAVLG